MPRAPSPRGYPAWASNYASPMDADAEEFKDDSRRVVSRDRSCNRAANFLTLFCHNPLFLQPSPRALRRGQVRQAAVNYHCFLVRSLGSKQPLTVSWTWQAHLNEEKQRRQAEGGGQMVPYGVPVAPPGALGLTPTSGPRPGLPANRCFENSQPGPRPRLTLVPSHRWGPCADAAIPAWHGSSTNDERVAARSVTPTPTRKSLEPIPSPPHFVGSPTLATCNGASVGLASCTPCGCDVATTPPCRP